MITLQEKPSGARGKRGRTSGYLGPRLALAMPRADAAGIHPLDQVERQTLMQTRRRFTAINRHKHRSCFPLHGSDSENLWICLLYPFVSKQIMETWKQLTNLASCSCIFHSTWDDKPISLKLHQPAAISSAFPPVMQALAELKRQKGKR